MGLKRKLMPVMTFIPMDVKRLFRDKLAIFFVFLFPLIFLLIFGSIFSGDNEVSFRIVVLNESKSEFSNKFTEQLRNNKTFKVDENITNLDAAKEKMSRGQLDATVILPAGFGELKNDKPGGELKIIYDQNSESAGQTLKTVMEGIFKDINAGLVKTETPFVVAAESTATKGLTRFDYTFAGLMGFTLLSLGIFGPVNVFPRLKQRGVLRRYHTTPLKVWQYFAGNVVSNGVAGVLAAGLMFIAAVIVFDLNMRGDYFSLFALIIIGATMLFGIGLAIGGWAKNENQAAPLAQLVTLPMMFLSGVFFPIFLMPDILQKITKYIPLTPVVEGVRLIVTEGKTIFEIGPQLTIILIWTVVVYIIAFRVFRWE